MNIYITSIFAAIVLIVIGGIVYERIAAVPAQVPTSGTWGGGSLVNPLSNSETGTTPPTSQPDLYQAVQSGPPFYYHPAPSGPQMTSGNITYGNSNDNFDFNAFIAELSQPKTTPAATNAGNTALDNAYAFIPQGLIGTTSTLHVLSASQRELYDYGNNAGSIVQRFEKDNANMAQVLKDQFEDPQNPQKISTLDDLASGLSNAGDNLKKIDPVPAQAAMLNAALAKNYQDMGAKLALVGAAQSDQARAQAMTVYNTSADGFIKNYAALSLVFSSSGVTFGQNDAGSVFTFAGSGF